MCGYEYFPSGYCNLLSASSTALFTNHTASKELMSMNALATNKYLNNTYQAIYVPIVRCNDVISKVQGGQASQEVKDRVEGEAHLLRAICYFNLVRMVGGVPLRLEPTTSINLNLPRSSKEDVYAAIISDLESAKSLIPETNPTAGRPNKYAAYALLAKVYLTMANGVEGSEYWAKALDEAKGAYGKYSLENLSKVFLSSNRNSKESIIEFQLTTAGGRANYWTRMIGPKDSKYTPLSASNPFYRIRPSKWLFDSWVAQYPGDPRLDVSFIYNSYVSSDGTKTTLCYPKNVVGIEAFPYFLKFLDPTYVSEGTSANFIYMRYADLLLILAEAENEVNGPTNAYKYVNEVLSRSRNGVSPASAVPADWSGMTKTEFREKIMKERLYELSGEQHEFFDLRRRGAQFLLNHFIEFNADANNNYNQSSSAYSEPKYTETLDFATKALLLPFPQNEINTNTVLTNDDQNPGY